MSPSPSEMLLVVLVALLLYGGDLPQVARSWGKYLSEFRKGLSGIQNEFNNIIYDEEPRRISYHESEYDTPQYDSPTYSEPEYSEPEYSGSESVVNSTLDNVVPSDESTSDESTTTEPVAEAPADRPEST